MIENIKKIKSRIYQFDFTNSELVDGNEIITTDVKSEFVMNFRKRDLDKGIIVTPFGYTKGLIYKSTNGGEVYNYPEWIPDVVSFGFNIYGLKKGQFYKLTIVARDTGNITMITPDRSLVVSNEDKELLLDENLKGVKENTEYHTIFRATDNETSLYFRLGKIFISDIIIDEIELFEEEEVEYNEESTVVIGDGKLSLVAYGVFTTESMKDETYKGRYVPMLRYAGKGLNLYLDKNTNQYVLERDNVEETLEESFTNINYIVDFNFNKVVNKGFFSGHNIVEVSAEPSPNTLKQGYITFEFVDSQGATVKYANSNSRIQVLIYKIF